MIKNLVIGSEGFVGKPLCRFLQAAGEQVIPFDIKRTPLEDARSAELDLAEIDRVYFLAWDVGGAKYLYREDVQFRQLDWNLRLLLNIMPQLKLSNKPFLFVSSQLAEEYDTVYGVTKRLGEVWTHLIQGVRVRLWNVYGAMEELSERSHVVADFVHQALMSGEIRMLTNGEERRQFIHIRDVCSALHRALSARLPGVYDITSFEWVSVRELAEIIASQVGARVTPGSRIGSTPITPIQGKVPGWVPTIDLQNGLREMIREAKALGMMSRT
jgi:nucleoside-diphosphate-sugar epimerase